MSLCAVCETYATACVFHAHAVCLGTLAVRSDTYQHTQTDSPVQQHLRQVLPHRQGSLDQSQRLRQPRQPLKGIYRLTAAARARARRRAAGAEARCKSFQGGCVREDARARRGCHVLMTVMLWHGVNVYLYIYHMRAWLLARSACMLSTPDTHKRQETVPWLPQPSAELAPPHCPVAKLSRPPPPPPAPNDATLPPAAKAPPPPPPNPTTPLGSSPAPRAEEGPAESRPPRPLAAAARPKLLRLPRTELAWLLPPSAAGPAGE